MEAQKFQVTKHHDHVILIASNYLIITDTVYIYLCFKPLTGILTCSDLALKTQQRVDWRQKATLIVLITVQSNNSN